jgi:2C-methyl-D-erythritol 2,4-cyclodiphosphate synthase
MDWTTIITALIAALLGSGGVGAFMYRKETKRGKQVENEKSLAEGWKELAEGKQARIDTLETTVEKKDEKIDAQYAEMAELRNIIDHLRTENAVLKVYKCVNVGCAERKPPFGSSTDFDVTTAKLG